MAAEGLDLDWYCYRHRTEDEVLPVGPPLGGAPQGLPLAGLAGRPRRGRPRGLPLDALLRLRRLHRLRHRARRGLGGPARRRQPGHRPGPPVGRRRAGGPVASPTGGGGGMKQRVRFAKRGKVRFLSHRDLARVWERALRRAGIRVAYSEGFSPRPAPELRPGALHRLREPRRVPRHRPGRRPRARGARGAGQPVAARRHGGAGRHPDPAGHRLAPAGGHQLVVGDRGRRRRRRPRRRRRWPRPWRPTSLPIVVERKGSETDLDARPAILALDARTAPRWSPSWPPNPAASAPRSCSEPSIPPGPRARSSEPTNGRRSTAPAASRSPSGTSAHAARRRPRTRKRVCDEKGTHP